ncbi:chorismate mutase [Tissierella pigra]|nr:chorismate mutase [Tissierella pigra]
MKTISIRGAITVQENSIESILDGTKELLTEIEKQNNLDREKVISIVFSCTNDLDKVYPAKAARDLGYIYAGLMCFNEMNVEGSLRKCIRVMIIYNSDISQKDVKHIYLRDAKVLRPDLLNNP